MPKVVVYIRAEDARSIELLAGREVAEWVREQVAKALAEWKAERARAFEEGRL